MTMMPMSVERSLLPDPRPVPTSPRDTTGTSRSMSSPSLLLTTKPDSARSMSIGIWVPSTTLPESTIAMPASTTSTVNSVRRRSADLPPSTSAASSLERPARDSSATTTTPKIPSSPPLTSGSSVTRPWRLDRPTRSTGPTLLLEPVEPPTSTRLLSTMVSCATSTWKPSSLSRPKILPMLLVSRPRSSPLSTMKPTTTQTSSAVWLSSPSSEWDPTWPSTPDPPPELLVTTPSVPRTPPSPGRSTASAT
mmetsp:Transcript_14916/g.34524  ORF Transcript_14916/g.34524 Transcript_14916/m.34524 type:complete len:250 (+) Transcript_14916:371-1120(+)